MRRAGPIYFYQLPCIVYAARRPADPVNPCPCFILRRFLPCASYLEIRFCAPFGALRLSARLIGGGWSYSESMILSRIVYLILHYIRGPGGARAFDFDEFGLFRMQTEVIQFLIHFWVLLLNE